MTNSVPLGPNSIVAARFVFEEQIGRGGMGTVFKARDLLKEEANDPYPRVAIKILNEEFKRHPNAVQALQREARKAQGLAHPHIVTVYDFDRDGADVFMVMELLEGQSLDRMIKDAEGTGVGFKEALRITREVCDAMSYAHERGIVHADFKPANVFVTREGVVKVLDFGIARAVKREDLGDGPHTLFDPGTLNALTPAYAGYEVIEGQDPDVRDDLYAIACVTYELLTGRHPFNRLSAEDACKANLLATRPKGLSRTQWKVLRSALEFRRDHRPASAQQFIEGLLPKRKSAVLYFGLAAAASAVIIGMYSTMHVMTHRDRAVSAALVSENTSQIESVMPWLRELTPERRATIFLDGAARAGLIAYFTQRVDATVDPERGRYDYAKAESTIKELWELLPDSQAVKSLVDRVSERRSYALQRESFAPALISFGDPELLVPDTRLEHFAASLRAQPTGVLRVESRRSRTDAQTESLADLLNVIERDNSTMRFSDAVLADVSLEKLPEPPRAKEGPQALAWASLRLASLAAKDGRIEDALELAKNAKQIAPALRATGASSERYSRYVEINDQLQHGERLSPHHLRFKIWRVSKLAPDEMPAVTQRWTRDLAERIRSAEDPALASHLSEVGRAIFGNELLSQPPLREVTAEAGVPD